MKTTRLLLAVSACLAPAFAAYTYDDPNLLNPYTSIKWTSNGTNSPSNNMYTSSATNGGSLIFQPALPAPSSNYEVRYTLALLNPGGNYLVYLRATSNALYSSPTSTGTFYAVQMANPNLSLGYYSATLNIIKCVNGSVTTLHSNTVYPHNGSVVRVVFTAGNGIVVYFDNMYWSSYYDTSPIASGQPGVGVSAAPAGSGMTAIDIGHLDTVAPGPINTQLVGTSVFPTRVDFQFPEVVDDANGTGIAYYQFYRDGNWVTIDFNPYLEDRTVLASTAYSYTLQALDFHGNLSQTTINVTTPPTGSIDPQEVGVRPTGTYWGAGGEQIDIRSGNLNFTIPLVKAMSRGGGGVGFNLSCNSQNWRQDPGGTWQLGRDVGYGYGCRLQLGSLTPIYSDYWTLHHYLFIDSTGAEYRLDVNDGAGHWTSKESIYVYYDTNWTPARLCFTNGTFWYFGSLSAGTEQDSGSMYPTQIYDSNGNSITITYDAAQGLTGTNSSARITQVEDVRGKGSADYTFTYDGTKHLTGITNTIGTAEKYTIGYTSQALTSPFTPATGFGNWTFLTSVANVIPLTTSLAYNTSGELNQVTFPYKGHIAWDYAPFTFVGTRTMREIHGRRLLTTPTGTETTYSLSWAGDPNLTFHTYSQVDDPDGQAERAFAFGTDSAQPGYGLLSVIDYRPHHFPNTAGGRYVGSSWTTDSLGNPYMSAVTTTEDNGNPTAVTKKTAQTLDQYGNVTQMQVFDYGNLSTPVRTYTNTYLAGANYTSRFIYNRLLSTSVTDGTRSTTLVTNYYDNNATGNSACGAYSLTNMTGSEHDSTDYGTSFMYRGNVHYSVTPAGTRCLSYDTGGNLLTHNLNGVTTNATMDSTKNYAVPSQITTSSLISNMSWSNFFGITSAAGPNGDTSTIGYDGTNGRVTTSTSPFGAITNYTYNDNPTPPALPTKVATTGTHWVKTTMDGLGRTIKTETGNGSTTVSVVDAVYVSCGCSPLGKMGQQSAPHTPAGAVYWTTYTYDGLGRTTQVQLPDGSITHYAYVGNTVQVTDPAGKSKTFTMDAFGNLTKVQEPDPALGTVSTNYTYDILNHLITVNMPRGSDTQTRTFNYLSGTTVGIDLLSATNPENGTINYTYNTDHTLATKGGLSYTYDSLKRLKTVSSGSTLLRTYVYDSNSLDVNFLGTYTQGRLVAVQHAAFTPQGYVAGQGGSDVTVPKSMQLTEMYNYTQQGPTGKKRLQFQETFHWYVNNVEQTSPQTLNLDAAYTYDTEGKMTSVNYPTTYSWNGTQLVPATGPTYTYSFDAMSRPTGLTDQNSNTVVNNVTYNAANQLLTFNNETRTYNNLNQMTRLTVTGQLDITYTFPAGGNNGKIASQMDNISGEQVTYQYDTLNRLVSASAATWSETYGFDGFGNLLSKTQTGGAPTLSQAVDAATNHIHNQSYDANGNQTSGPLGTVAYDAENRIASVSGAGVQYAYDSQNKRIWKSTLTNGIMTQEFYFYGVDGQKLGTYTAGLDGLPTLHILTDQNTNLAVFFGGKRLGIFDRLGTAKYNQTGAPMKFYPYGEERGTITPNDTLKFATYTRDTSTGLDYADQRYYANNFGRYMAMDRTWYGTDSSRPASWNRYSYVEGDPVNYNDPAGLYIPGIPPPNPPDVPNPDTPGPGGWPCQLCPQTPAPGAPLPSAVRAELLFESEQRVKDDLLSKKDCAADFKNLKKVLSKLTQVQFKDLGEIVFQTQPNGKKKSVGGPEGEERNWPFHVFLNTWINWQNPNNTPDIVDGKPDIYRALDAESVKFGLPVSAADLMDITILHELAHYQGEGDPDNVEFEKKLFKDCVK